MKKEEDWTDYFIRAFGQVSNSFEFRNQNDFVQQQNAVTDRNQIDEMNRDVDGYYKDDDDNLNMKAEDDTTGDKYVLELKRKTQQPDKKDVAITFSCINDKSKFVDSTISSLCEGKYAAHAGSSLKTIASVLCNDYEYIFNYVDASIAQYSDSIDVPQAIKIAALAKNEKGMISFIDYEKISSKLSVDSQKEFDKMLVTAGVKIYYPLGLIKVAGLN